MFLNFLLDPSDLDTGRRAEKVSIYPRVSDGTCKFTHLVIWIDIQLDLRDEKRKTNKSAPISISLSIADVSRK